MRPIITSRKHILQIPIDSRMAGTSSTTNIARAEQVADHTNVSHVDVGATVKAVYIELWLLAGSQQPGSITVTVEKLPSNLNGPTFTQMATLHTYPNKNNIFYSTQGLTPDANGNPIPFIRQWIKIPKGKQRMSINDKLVFTVSANVEDISTCGLIIYKDYT